MSNITTSLALDAHMSEMLACALIIGEQFGYTTIHGGWSVIDRAKDATGLGWDGALIEYIAPIVHAVYTRATWEFAQMPDDHVYNGVWMYEVIEPIGKEMYLFMVREKRMPMVQDMMPVIDAYMKAFFHD